MNHRVEKMINTAHHSGGAKVFDLKMKYGSEPDFISLAFGEPDFDTPNRITVAAIRSLTEGNTHYSGGGGTGVWELRKAIKEKMQRDHGIRTDEKHIFMTPGAKFAIYLALNAILDAGDEAIILDPSWVSYGTMVESTGADDVHLPLRRENNYRITREALDSVVSERTRAVIMCYPNNPTGCVLHEDEADVMEQFLLDHPGVYLISDEIYEAITYNDVKVISMGARESIRERVITINGFSKSVAMTGWRLGYLVVNNDEIAKGVNRLYQDTLSVVPGFIQVGAIEAFHCQHEIEEMRQIYQKRRDYFVSEINRIPGVTCQAPEGAFYAWVFFDGFGMSSDEMFEYLLREAKVLGMPGSQYGDFVHCTIRFSFAASFENIEQALKRIKQAIEALQK